jgi:hypothetical protein
MTFKTIRQTAALGILSEHRLRLMQKAGMLPGIYTGNRFMVNVDMLKEQLQRACEVRGQQDGEQNSL